MLDFDSVSRCPTFPMIHCVYEWAWLVVVTQIPFNSKTFYFSPEGNSEAQRAVVPLNCTKQTSLVVRIKIEWNQTLAVLTHDANWYINVFWLFPPLQELEQGRHELRLKLEGSQSQWESQVGDLERDVRELSGRVERLTQALSEAERDKSRAELQHSEHTQRLREQLNTVS